MAERIEAKQNIFTKVDHFYRADHLNQWMGNVHKWNQEGGLQKAKAHFLGNITAIGMDLGGFFFNIIKAPFITAAQPATSLVIAGSALTDKIVRQTKLDTDKAEFRRKMLRILPKIIEYTPSILDVAETIFNIVRYAIGFFSSLTLGFIFVEANLWVHHKLGLICNPKYAKEDRKKQILMEIGDEKKLKENYELKFKEYVDKAVVKILRKIVYGNNQEIIDTTTKVKHFITDENSHVRQAVDQAVQEKRALTKAGLEKEKGRELTAEEMKYYAFMYWRKLSDPFDMNDIPAMYKEKLSYYFNLEENSFIKKSDAVSFPFRSKEHYEEYMQEYNKWNLTLDPRFKGIQPWRESEAILSMLSSEMLNPTNEQRTAAHFEAEKELIKERYAKNRKLIEKEVECAEFDQRVASEIKAKLQALRKESDNEFTVEEKQIKVLIDIEKDILTSTKGEGENLKAKEIDDIIEIRSQKLKVEISPGERKDLHTFALTALETLQDMPTKEKEWSERVGKARLTKNTVLNEKIAKAKLEVYQKTKILVDIEKKILKLAKAESKNPTSEKVSEIIERGAFKLNEEDLAALNKFASKALETIEKHETKLKEAFNKNRGFLPSKFYYDLKNMPIRQLRFERPRSVFDQQHLYDIKNNHNIDHEIMALVDAKIDKMIEEELALFQKALQNKINLGKVAEKRTEETEEKIAKTLKEMIQHYNEVEKPRLYEQLLLEKMFPASDHTHSCTRHHVKKNPRKKNPTVHFEGLEKARRNAFEAFKNSHYKANQKGDIVPRKIIETKAYRKCIEKKDNAAAKPFTNENIKIKNREWAQVHLQFTHDDVDDEIKMFFVGKKRVKNEAGRYEDGEVHYDELRFRDLDLVEIRKNSLVKDKKTKKVQLFRDTKLSGMTQRKKVFEAASRKYRLNASRIEETYFGHHNIKQIHGVEKIVDKRQKKMIKEELLYEALGNKCEESDKQKEENLKLQLRIQNLEAKVSELQNRKGNADFDANRMLHLLLKEQENKNEAGVEEQPPQKEQASAQ